MVPSPPTQWKVILARRACLLDIGLRALRRKDQEIGKSVHEKLLSEYGSQASWTGGPEDPSTRFELSPGLWMRGKRLSRHQWMVKAKKARMSSIPLEPEVHEVLSRMEKLECRELHFLVRMEKLISSRPLEKSMSLQEASTVRSSVTPVWLAPGVAYHLQQSVQHGMASLDLASPFDLYRNLQYPMIDLEATRLDKELSKWWPHDWQSLGGIIELAEEGVLCEGDIHFQAAVAPICAALALRIETEYVVTLPCAQSFVNYLKKLQDEQTLSDAITLIPCRLVSKICLRGRGARRCKDLIAMFAGALVPRHWLGRIALQPRRRSGRARSRYSNFRKGVQCTTPSTSDLD